GRPQRRPPQRRAAGSARVAGRADGRRQGRRLRPRLGGGRLRRPRGRRHLARRGSRGGGGRAAGGGRRRSDPAALSAPRRGRPGLLTHFAVADEPDNPYTARQVATFEAVRKELARLGIRPPLIHAANSAAVLTAPDTHYDLVRCGIAIYGIAPASELDGLLPL